MTQKSYIVPDDIWHHVDVPLEVSHDPYQFLRIGYGGTQRGRFWEPSGPRDEFDYIQVAHFTRWKVKESYTICVQPFYQYVVDLGHGLMLVPSKEEMPIPHRPDWHRNKGWEVWKHDSADWKDTPIKKAGELLEPKKKSA